jgi:hypothetical protein
LEVGEFTAQQFFVVELTAVKKSGTYVILLLSSHFYCATVIQRVAKWMG